MESSLLVHQIFVEPEGLRTNEQALVIRKLYEEYDCDYIVLDTNGIRLMPLYIVICNVKRERNGNAEMPTRVEGFIHTQRIGVQIIHPRARAIW